MRFKRQRATPSERNEKRGKNESLLLGFLWFLMQLLKNYQGNRVYPRFRHLFRIGLHEANEQEMMATTKTAAAAGAHAKATQETEWKIPCLVCCVFLSIFISIDKKQVIFRGTSVLNLEPPEFHAFWVIHVHDLFDGFIMSYFGRVNFWPKTYVIHETKCGGCFFFAYGILVPLYCFCVCVFFSLPCYRLSRCHLRQLKSHLIERFRRFKEREHMPEAGSLSWLYAKYCGQQRWWRRWQQETTVDLNILSWKKKWWKKININELLK